MPKKKTPDPGNDGPESGSGSGSGTPATASTASTDEKTWTRGNDPDAAAAALLQANRGSTGAENMPVPKRTPSA